jgi:hypothetical protein
MPPPQDANDFVTWHQGFEVDCRRNREFAAPNRSSGFPEIDGIRANKLRQLMLHNLFLRLVRSDVR